MSKRLDTGIELELEPEFTGTSRNLPHAAYWQCDTAGRAVLDLDDLRLAILDELIARSEERTVEAHQKKVRELRDSLRLVSEKVDERIVFWLVKG